MKNVVSLSLFRHSACDYNKPESLAQQGEWAGYFYERCLPSIIHAYLVLYPGWEIRIHHDDSVFRSPYASSLMKMHDEGIIRMVYMGRAETLGQGSLWRFAPLTDADVEVFITRDVDSLPTPRESGLVRDWLSTTESVHCIHDAPVHTGLMTGMLGIRRGRVAGRLALADPAGSFYDDPNALHGFGLRSGLDMNVKEHDQTVLNRLLARAAVGSALIHRAECAPASPPFESIVIAPDYIGGPVAGERHAYQDEFYREWNGLTRCIGSPFDPRPAQKWLNRSLETGFVASDARDCVRAAQWCEDYTFMMAPGSKIGNKRVLLSCDASPVYAFFLPIVAAAWRALGFQPTIMLVGDTPDPCRHWVKTPALDLAMREAVRAGADVRFVAARKGFLPSTVAQCVRVTAASIDGLRPDEYVLTGDVDMIPLRDMTNFLKQGMPDAWMHLYHGYAYEHEPEAHFPLCYMGATVEHWRHFLPVTLDECLDALGARDTWDSETSWKAWNHDEKWASARIAASPDFGGHVQRIRRNPDLNRVDRAWWDRSPAVELCVDCHALRPGYSDENWGRIREVLGTIFDTNKLDRVSSYRDLFLRYLA